MIYSNACAYAIHAMTRMALLRPDGYILLEELCAGTDLPQHFVAKIFQDLVRQGLLVSAKGRGGGFALRRSPGKITLYDIMVVVDGQDNFESWAAVARRSTGRHADVMPELWAPIGKKVRAYLVETTLDDMSKALAFKLKALGQKPPKLTSRSKPLHLTR